MTDKHKKEATPCAASPNPQSPTPTAAPSQSPGPATAHGACTGMNAPGGQMYSAKTGMIYAVRQQLDGVYRIMCCYAGEEWERTTIPVLSAPCSCAESLQELLDAFARGKGWKAYESADPCKECRCKTCGDNSCLQAHCDGGDHGMGCIREDGCYVPAEAEPPAEPAPANTTAEPAADGNEPEENALAANPVTSDLSQPAAFDYSGLDAQTMEDLHLAEREYKGGKRLVETGLRRMAGGVAIAHDALVANCDKHNNQHSEDNFRRFCADVLDIGKDAAYRLLQVNKLFDSSSPKEQKVLETLGPSLLYAAAKPSAPAELVQGVKEGSITTHKQYQELLKENQQLRTDRVNAVNRATAAEGRAQTAEAQRDAALADVDGLSQRNTMLQSELKASEDSAAEKDALIRELEARPVEVVGATPADIARWRAEGAEKARRESQKELRRANAEAAKERKRADEAERDRDAYADTMEQYASQLGELRGRQEMTDDQLHAIYTAEKAADTCTMVICQALGEIYDLPRDLKAQAMEHLLNLCICLRKAVDLGYWPTEEDFEDEPDEWPEEDDADV